MPLPATCSTTDYSQNPRTVILSTHLIDEVSDLLEHVILIDKGTIVIDSDADDLRQSAFVLSGAAAAVDRFMGDRRVLHRESLGTLARVSIERQLSLADRSRAASLGIEVESLSLQQLIIRNTTALGSDSTKASDPTDKESAS